ncbi:MAG: nucleotidyltransferase family protein [Prevotellaceae bacterium]|nr:nucleotidyltransferase family protein [Prevotellaceae bacterium]
MNNFKWLKLIRLSVEQECMGLAYDGILRYINARQIILAEKVIDEWGEVLKKCEDSALEMNNCIVEMFDVFTREPRLFYPVLLRGRGMALNYPNPLHYYCSQIDWYIPTEEKAREADAWAKREAKIKNDDNPNCLQYIYKDVAVANNHFAQELLDRKMNKALQTLVIREKSYFMPNTARINATNVEILPPTINLLVQILYVMQHMLTGGIKPQMFIDLGVLVRKLDNQIDYIKIERWLNELKMQKIADYEGGLLIRLFGFKKEEIPFMQKYYEKATGAFVNHIFSDENMKLISTTPSSLENKHTGIKKYLPREITANYFHKIVNIFSNIDE